MKQIDQITLRQLKALKAVADNRTVVAAAETLHLTGPAIHNQLKNLEEIVGSEVLDRDVRGRNELTPQGLVMVRAYDEIRATLTRALQEISAIGSGYRGSLTLGVVSTGKYFAPRIVALLGEEMPDVAINLRIGNRGEVLEALNSGAYDLCIMGRPPRGPLVDAQPIGPHPHVIIARPDHPLAGRHGLRPHDLAGERFVIREQGSGTRVLAERFLGEVSDGRPVAMIEMTSNETIKQAVLHGLGIAIISAHTVAYELEAGRLVLLDVQGMPIRRTWYVTSPAHVARTLVAENVSNWLVANATRFLPEVSV